ncbi:aldehyde dehydrogenase (NADP(+)) [Streptomyces sp. NBS 14/10]|uniref:aldehyde dehydrogenase (NADP(+)) n=1 Tax=Streptomyces sp. NBS 14/10 TaxID=1945643 RepID=UPI000B7CD74F|nr:aldehyde dehydrogenase (NADP(+)) [Streptomyces sp. NBS 14/10]KAK1185196.1 aldehyde dehydrogenase (NADP(+)) [Streptomyces sp. NBS 14/10]
MNVIQSIDPSTGRAVDDVATATTPKELDAVVERATAASVPYEAGGRPLRAAVLRAVADGLEARRPEIVALGMRETALPEARLGGELTRTVYQARLFAEVVEDGGLLEATIDHAGETPMGAGPDLRRMLVPLGPVAIFGASNFPLAFSVPGGDTVSALAAGCPVVLKAHDSHPALSRLVFETMVSAVAAVGAPDGLLGLVFGRKAGTALVAHPDIRAVGFTGSLTGGRALLDIINARPDPIPFYGELAGLNPVVVTEGAARARPAEIAAGLVGSVTGSAGQLCTKPGLVLVPAGEAGNALVAEAARLIDQASAATLLNSRIATAYEAGTEELRHRAGGMAAAEGSAPSGSGFSVTPRLFEIDSETLGDEPVGECFGPAAVVVRYAPGDAEAVLRALPASLTGTIHAEADETETVRRLTDVLRPLAGRLLYNGFPTGVLVSWAQHHGGPWPSTNSLHTSVGPYAVRRFLRPVTWQNAPQEVLPEELRDGYSGIPRRIDGRLTVPD